MCVVSRAAVLTLFPLKAHFFLEHAFKLNCVHRPWLVLLQKSESLLEGMLTGDGEAGPGDNGKELQA